MLDGAPSHVNTWLVEHHLFPRDVSYLPSIDAVKRLVEADVGITVLAYFSTERELASGHLALLDLPGSHPGADAGHDDPPRR
jgi:DNA-binding transcriptional LysR family regulator